MAEKETRKIVILGASFGGLGTFHYLCKHVLPQLKAKEASGPKYEIHLVGSSSRFWWNIAAPRQIVTIKELSVEKTFIPIADILKQYPALEGSLFFHHATATSLEPTARTVTISKHEGGGEEVLEYYALVIATGVRSPTPLTTFHGDYSFTQKALEEMNAKLPTAKEIVISGGGPVGVETAGEIGYAMQGKAKITLIAGAEKLLPVFSKARALKAQKLLEKVGVTVLYNVRVVNAEAKSEDGRMEVELDNGKKIPADVYIPAWGVKPNSEFLPAKLKSSAGFVETDRETMRVEGAGERVFAAGDVAGVDSGGVLCMQNSLPVMNRNLARDLLGEGEERKYAYKAAETQFVPVGPKTGVAAFNGWGVPGFVVALVKGRDYMVGMSMADFTQGKAFNKA